MLGRNSVLFAAAALVATSCAASAQYVHLTSRSEPGGGDPWASLAAGWTELPPPPEVRDGAAYVWIGDRVLAWGGVAPGSTHRRATEDGYAFDPETMSWTSIPSAPVAGKYARAVWTGDEAIILGVGTDPSRLQGEAFDSAAGT